MMRVPIIVTGNDFSTLYAPLLRDGRMDKFLWEPTAEDKAEAVYAMLGDAGMTRQEAGALVGAFPNQPLDFFGAIHSRSVDDAVREWIVQNGGCEGKGRALMQSDATRRAVAAAASRGRSADGDEDGLDLGGGGEGGSELQSSGVSGVGSGSGGGDVDVGVGGSVLGSTGFGGVGPWEIGRPTVQRGRLTLDTLLSLGYSLEQAGSIWSICSIHSSAHSCIRSIRSASWCGVKQGTNEWTNGPIDQWTDQWTDQ